jgi:integrase
MASLRFETDRGREGWRLRFYADKKQKSIWLGGISEVDAQLWKSHIELLQGCQVSGDMRDPATTRWLAGLSSDQKSKLAKYGLIEYSTPAEGTAPAAVKVDAYLESYFNALKADMKESTWTFYGHTRKRLVEYFAGRDLSSISAMDARAFRNWLETESNQRDKPAEDGTIQPLAANTVRRRVGVCKRIFSQAVDDGLITSNPFAKMPSTVRANKARKEYIPLDTFAKVLAKAPDARWRALMVLARIAGLRIPSEVCGLLWSDVDWKAKRLLVRSPKTEHHEGHESRVIPLFPAVEAELAALKVNAEALEVFPTITMESNLRTTFEKIIKRAKVPQWPKLWQNLRASAATDMARRLPSHIATAICGHSIEIAQEHYWTVAESDFDEILTDGKIGGLIGGLNSGQTGATTGNSDTLGAAVQECVDQAKPRENAPEATTGNLGQKGVSGRGGTRTPDIHGVNVAL